MTKENGMSHAGPRYNEPSKPFLSARSYDALKFVAQIALPGLGTLYFALAQVWGFDNGIEVVGTITAVDVFLGLLLGVSSKAFNNSAAKYDGEIQVLRSPSGGKTFSLELNSDPNDLESKKDVVFKVNPLS